MFGMTGAARRFCDGVSRRDFLKVGATGIAGLSLPQLLRAEALAGAQATGRSIINIYLPGGPTHMDTFDLKPNAPREFRGEFSPIATKVAGMEICELMPMLASVADKTVIVRSITGMNNEHDPRQSDSGWSERDLKSLGGRPGVGSVLSRLYGTVQNGPQGTAPTAVDLNNWGKSGYLGPMHMPFRPDGAARQNLSLNKMVTESRFDERNDLLAGFDRFRSEADAKGMMDALDSFEQRAVSLITSGKVASALDTTKESQEVLERYGIKKNRDNERFLLARKLVQAGVRSVALSWGGWDTHSQNFASMQKQLPALDRALSALIEDLERHDLLDKTILLMSGEFGRTPRINGTAGRDHWPQAAFFWMAGGGLKTGQVIGSTNRLGEKADDRPVHIQEVFATVYHQLGVDLEVNQLTDTAGRPQYILDHRRPITELV
ncbi:MAG: DUF1501 domain-containing protein [Planctomycetota bacterium]|nr:MAG: DUF1501 domain-containing protein [Planctomycetota bacterium]